MLSLLNIVLNEFNTKVHFGGKLPTTKCPWRIKEIKNCDGLQWPSSDKNQNGEAWFPNISLGSIIAIWESLKAYSSAQRLQNKPHTGYRASKTTGFIQRPHVLAFLVVHQETARTLRTKATDQENFLKTQPTMKPTKSFKKAEIYTLIISKTP